MDQSVKDLLAQDEGVSDFRSVLRKSAAPTRVGGRTAPAAEQTDFRQVLHKADPVEKKQTDRGPRQEDFRGNLKRSGVQTKDCSSAAPRRTGGPRQEDFRGLLRKAGEEETSSSSNPQAAEEETNVGHVDIP